MPTDNEIHAQAVKEDEWQDGLPEPDYCPDCGADMSKQSKRGSKEVPCAECYLGGLVKKIDNGEIKL